MTLFSLVSCIPQFHWKSVCSINLSYCSLETSVQVKWHNSLHVSHSKPLSSSKTSALHATHGYSPGYSISFCTVGSFSTCSWTVTCSLPPVSPCLAARSASYLAQSTRPEEFLFHFYIIICVPILVTANFVHPVIFLKIQNHLLEIASELSPYSLHFAWNLLLWLLRLLFKCSTLLFRIKLHYFYLNIN